MYMLAMTMYIYINYYRVFKIPLPLEKIPCIIHSLHDFITHLNVNLKCNHLIIILLFSTPVEKLVNKCRMRITDSRKRLPFELVTEILYKIATQLARKYLNSICTYKVWHINERADNNYKHLPVPPGLKAVAHQI